MTKHAAKLQSAFSDKLFLHLQQKAASGEADFELKISVKKSCSMIKLWKNIVAVTYVLFKFGLKT
jgi:hypothetical protein